MKRIPRTAGIAAALFLSLGVSAAAGGASAPPKAELPLPAAENGIEPLPQVDAQHPDRPVLGRYFARTKYEPAPLAKFETTRDKLPSPIYDENASWVAMYWKSWELAFRNFHEPAPGSGYVSQFIDAAFNQNVFQWNIRVHSDGKFTLNVSHGGRNSVLPVEKGDNVLAIPEPSP